MKKTTKKKAAKKTAKKKAAKRPALARFGRKVARTAQYGGMMAAVPPPRPGVDSQRVHDAAEMVAANHKPKQTGNPLLNFRVTPIVHEALKHLASTAQDWNEKSVGSHLNKAVFRYLDLAENKKRLPKNMVAALAEYGAKMSHRIHRY